MYSSQLCQTANIRNGPKYGLWYGWGSKKWVLARSSKIFKETPQVPSGSAGYCYCLSEPVPWFCFVFSILHSTHSKVRNSASLVAWSVWYDLKGFTIGRIHFAWTHTHTGWQTQHRQACTHTHTHTHTLRNSLRHKIVERSFWYHPLGSKRGTVGH